MGTDKVKLWVRSMALAGGILCAAVAAGTAAYAGLAPEAEEALAGDLTMIDPFALQLIVLHEMPPSSEAEGLSASAELHLEQTIRIPDRPMVRSVFKPLP